ncbi:5'-deoxynucleotidase [Ruminococcaceae bacterium KH2T8]|nr:5'-deoxynucleotidase [Ruminococcaceae bacterium KH2T8]
MEDNKAYGFYAMLDRMQYINRWGLMRNNRVENIKEHSFDVAVIAHALAVLHNAKFPDPIKVDRYQVLAYALYHDCTEIITGDLPTPIKYRNETIKQAYKEVEHEAAERLSSLLPEVMQDEYLELLDPAYEGEEGIMIKKLVKAADRIAAYIKCLTEEASGNTEFTSAKETILSTIDNIKLPEVDYFMEKFVPSYGFTLDELNAGRKDETI